MNKAKDYIILDKQVAIYFLHEMNHLKLDMVPQEIQDIEFTLRTGQRTTIGKMVAMTKERAEKLGNYIRLAIYPPEET